MRQELLAHTDTIVAYGELQDRFIVILSAFLYNEADFSALRCELDRIAQYVDQHLLELHFISDVIVADVAFDRTVICKVLIFALTADNGIDLFKAV